MSTFRVNVTAFRDSSSNFTIPYNTWYDLSNELTTFLKLAFPRLETQLVTTTLTTISTAMYTACAVAAAKALMPQRPSPSTLLAATLAMYLGAFVYWTTVLAGQFRTLRQLRANVAATAALVSPLDCFLVLAEKPGTALPAHCATIPNVSEFVDIAPTWDFTQECAGTVALALNVTLGDAIVWWRVWVLWGRSRLVLALVSALLLATLSAFRICLSFAWWETLIRKARFRDRGRVVHVWGTLASFQVLGPRYGSTTVTAVGSLFTNSGFGFVAICFSLLSNAASTGMVGYKAWKHRRDTRVLGTTRVEGLLVLLVESGVAYCVLWVFILGSQIAWIASPTTLGATSWSTGIVYFTEGCLIAFVGIYPTLIIALVALNKSRADAPQSSGYALPTLGGSFPLSPLRRNSDLSTVGDVRQRASHRAGLDPFAKRMPSDSETFTHLSEETVHWQDDGDETGKESFIP
ncbi:hypothetical protein GSI_11336 [Ganoderma sinense ZZ0214-1]|uniref:Uncharacterized protein n=1 Tax=Ganoderma sinense ZZ0214-1 TaxID=1077348 RepID=A0A2G8RW76_9APHY|nr:hypothetical protein GSI_11336 [Ganoderma sinense ZZ0214-1]